MVFDDEYEVAFVADEEALAAGAVLAEAELLDESAPPTPSVAVTV